MSTTDQRDDLLRTALQKEERLKDVLKHFDTLLIAYSGGVDSTYLCDVAHEVLGARAQMVLADSPSLPRSEFSEATELAKIRGWDLTVIHTDEFENEEYLKNDGRRCYFCRTALFRKMKEYATANKVAVLAYGAMADDAFDPTRLGAIAAAEHDVVAPLQRTELGKDEIRALSRRRELPTSEKAAFACLSSRFPQGTRVTVEDLRKIEAAEEALKGMGLYQYRARHHGDVCRIEIDMADLEKFMVPTTREKLVKTIISAGYKYVALDLCGYKDAAIIPFRRST